MSRRRSPRGRCLKVRFGTELDARIALASTQRADLASAERRREVRYYPCPLCHGYHLTSKHIT